MITIHNLKYQYKTYRKGTGFCNSVKDFWHRKYEYIDALDIAQLAINKGEIVGLLGPNGAGKTTLIKILTGILALQNGEVRCDNYIPYQKNKAYLQEIGVVIGQKSQLIWDLPSIDTIKMLQSIYEIDEVTFRARLDHLLGLLNLTDKSNIPVRKLSLGERLKFELVCSLLHQPKILFLDEPTIGVDIVSQRAIYQFLLQLNQEEKTTILLTSHNMKDIEALCQRILVLLKGRIVLDTDITTLKQQYRTEKKYILHTKTDVFPFKDIPFRRIEACRFEMDENNILALETNQQELEEIIFDYFQKDSQ